MGRKKPTETRRRRGGTVRRSVTARARRSRRRMILFCCITVLTVIVAFVVLSLTVFFRVDSIHVSNQSTYSDSEIVRLCGIEEGENLFLVDAGNAKKTLDKSLPLSGGIRVEKKFPATIVITVQKPVVSGAFEQDGQYVVVSDEKKILEITDEKPTGCPLIQGYELVSPKPGNPVQAKDEKTRDTFELLTRSLKAGEFSPITRIDVGDIYSMMVEYDGRIRVLLGNSNDLDLKVAAAKKIVEGELESDEHGELDVSLTRDLKKAYYNADSSQEEESSESES